MVLSHSHAHKAQKPAALDARRIRAALMLRNQSIRGWAKNRGVSDTLVRRIIHGTRAGVRGKSAAIRTALVRLQGGAQ